MGALFNKMAFLSLLTLLASPAMAAMPETLTPVTHSAYRVTTYSLGNITDFASAIAVSPRDYEPLMITGAASDVLSGQRRFNPLAKSGSNIDAVEGFAIAARFEAGKSFAFKGAFGVTHNVWSDDLKAENRSSWEANLGVIYSLLPNLNYELHLGYMDTGDVFKNRSEYSDIENIIMISNKLTLSF
ncbi:MAG: hypothetical protein LBU39_02270 [Desulfobulbaceae bacterium]|jgi:hypothetical protein|nr:hypothetical protein [Desulfobulbaceae bacterium]